MTPDHALVHVVGFSKTFGDVPALSDVCCSIRPGEILGLIGPNGAGKTTFFETLAAVRPLDSGDVLRGRVPLTLLERRHLIAYVPDNAAPWNTERVDWVLDFAVGFFRGRSNDRGRIIDALDLGSLLTAPVGALSKGERKRVLLGVGLLLPHPILLIDEPFDGLDLRQTRQVGAALRSFVDLSRTLFLSIHQIGDAARLCDRLILLHRGRVVGEGTVRELSHTAAARGVAEGQPLEEVFLALT